MSDNQHQTMTMEASISSMMDVRMFYALLILIGTGVIMMTSTTVELGYKGYGDAFYYVKKQMIFMLLGGLSVWVLTRIR